MCGIDGIVSRKAINDLAQTRLERMNVALTHRGPDSAGEFHADHVALAMRRLSIIDLSGGQQPISNETGTLTVICNGEIYNYIELAEELRARGHILKTGSDVETILHLYEDYGVECVQHLRGMFAFALWDAEKRQLLVARDRIGEKPLYLWQNGDSVYFASELKSLLQAIPETPELDPAAIDLYFHYQYVPEPATPFKTIRKLPAAHRLIVRVDPWQVREECYWNPLNAPAIDGNPAEYIRAELETISKIVIRSDVPVGIALSGGLDSGAIALLSAPKYPETMRAFSVGYPGSLDNDERPQARALAQQLGIPFYDVELTTQQLVDFFPQLMRAADDPVADIAAYPQYAVMRLAADHGVKVMLNGLGGDELFWGYGWVREAARRSEQRSKQSGLRRWLDNTPDDQLSFYDLERGFKAFRPRMDNLYSAEMKARSARNPYQPFTEPKPWRSPALLITQRIFDTWLLGNCIALGDRLSMASSVELRLPLLDYRLVEVVFGLRKCHSDHDLPPKAWLKAALADLLPSELVNRPKRGFTPPVGEWIRALLAVHHDQLTNGLLVSNGYLQRQGIDHLTKVAPKSGPDTELLYKCLVFEVWYQQMVGDARQSYTREIAAKAS